MIGPRGVGSLRQIGPKLLSLLLTGTSMPMLVSGAVENPHANRTHLPLALAATHGNHKSWIQRVSRG